ncbi:hypothetical protein ASD64_09105 [Mesorhizobium sp. Root157]|uniref:hypothetical protein n=1 Tax=Mesorhizobium sp. Root157 TaxID=1736477 RepID=UPI0006FAA978|nr:hypothetical protein [Mesorhizobium sp. Root157]KQZ82044.1 hypothetical protein ASD64_09105 [Mesorhizobium sp. Root157]
MLTYFVVQSFDRTRLGFLVPDIPVQAQDRAHALRLADRLAGMKSGVIAFSRTGDPSIGEFEDAVVIASYGEVPALEGELAIAS